MTAVARFRQADLTRAMKGAKAAGVRWSRIEIDPATGRIVIVSEAMNTRQAGPNDWDQDL